jgi:Fe-S-cluster-containing dehydrogenase component
MTRHPEYRTVYVNQERCIGCGACEEACPYGVPHVNDEIEKSRKCTGCFDRVANGMLPACAKTCPTHAIRYGSKKEMYALAQKRVKELKAQGHKSATLYGLKQLSGLHSIYVLPGKLAVYDLPETPKLGNLEPIIRKAQEKYAAWQREHRRSKLASATGTGVPGLLATAGLAAAGLKKLADRKAERGRESD